MKIITKTLLLSASLVALAAQAQAGEVILSPRAQANRPAGGSCCKTDAKSSSGSDLSAALSSTVGEGAKAKALGNRSVARGSAQNDPDLAHPQMSRIGSPRALQQSADNAKVFQVAPLR